MFWKKNKRQNGAFMEISLKTTGQQEISMDLLKQVLANLDDAEIIERQNAKDQNVTFVYIRTLIDEERMNESIIEPVILCTHDTILDCMSTTKVSEIFTLAEAQKQLLKGSIIIYDVIGNQWLTAPLRNNIGRSIETSDTETILYGAKDSFSEQIEVNMTLIRRRLPLAELKAEKFKVGSLSDTTVVLMYMEG